MTAMGEQPDLRADKMDASSTPRQACLPIPPPIASFMAQPGGSEILIELHNDELMADSTLAVSGELAYKIEPL